MSLLLWGPQGAESRLGDGNLARTISPPNPSLPRICLHSLLVREEPFWATGMASGRPIRIPGANWAIDHARMRHQAHDPEEPSQALQGVDIFINPAILPV